MFAVDTEHVRREADASYLIVEGEHAAFVDTGTHRSVPNLLGALVALDIDVEQVDYVLLTHVHLDHAGGAGTLMASLPRARIVVHPRGAPHLIDPAKLVAATRTVYGDEVFAAQFGDAAPIPARRVATAEDGERLVLGARTPRISAYTRPRPASSLHTRPRHPRTVHRGHLRHQLSRVRYRRGAFHFSHHDASAVRSRRSCALRFRASHRSRRVARTSLITAASTRSASSHGISRAKSRPLYALRGRPPLRPIACSASSASCSCICPGDCRHTASRAKPGRSMICWTAMWRSTPPGSTRGSGAPLEQRARDRRPRRRDYLGRAVARGLCGVRTRPRLRARGIGTACAARRIR